MKQIEEKNVLILIIKICKRLNLYSINKVIDDTDKQAIIAINQYQVKQDHPVFELIKSKTVLNLSEEDTLLNFNNWNIDKKPCKNIFAGLFIYMSISNSLKGVITHDVVLNGEKGARVFFFISPIISYLDL